MFQPRVAGSCLKEDSLMNLCVCFQRLERCVGIVQSLTNGLSDREANDALTANVRSTHYTYANNTVIDTTAVTTAG